MDSMQTMEDQKLIQAELPGGESLRWVGRPDPARLFVRALPRLVFGLFFGGFAAFWIRTAYQGSRSVENADGAFKTFFPLFGVPFLLIGLSMILSPLWDWHKGRGTIYGISARRVIIFERHLFGKRVRSYGPDQFTGIERSGGDQGRGDVIFREERTRGRRGRTNTKQIGLWGIHGARQVEQQIMRMQEEDRK